MMHFLLYLLKHQYQKHSYAGMTSQTYTDFTWFKCGVKEKLLNTYTNAVFLTCASELHAYLKV
jgi:squalene cyclase